MDYFDPDYFDPDYFDTPDTGGGGGPKRFRLFIEPPAEIEKVDEGWIHIIL